MARTNRSWTTIQAMRRGAIELLKSAIGKNAFPTWCWIHKILCNDDDTKAYQIIAESGDARLKELEQRAMVSNEVRFMLGQYDGREGMRMIVEMPNEDQMVDLDFLKYAREKYGFSSGFQEAEA